MDQWAPEDVEAHMAFLRRVSAMLEENGEYVGVWNLTGIGAAAPRSTPGGPGGMLRNIPGVALDPKNKEVIITDKDLNGILTYHFPEVF